jgi:tetratricopeptide (TPR) repeat protein
MDMRRILPLVTVLFIVACMQPEKKATLRALQNGTRHYANGRYAEAATAFDAAPDDARAVYNAGVALFHAHDAAGAAARFKQSSDRADTLQARALYDLGTTLAFQALWSDSLSARMAEELGGIRIEGDDIARKVELWVLRDSLQRMQRSLRVLADSSLMQAEAHLKGTLRLLPNDERARYNLASVKAAIAKRRTNTSGNGDNDEKDRQQELSDRAKMLVEQADKLVDEYKFKEALDLLRGGLQKEPSLKNEEEFMQKLEVVTKAAQAQ